MIFKGLASVEVQDRHNLVVKECRWVLVRRSRGWSNNIGSWDMGRSAGSYGRWHRMAVLVESLVGNGIR